MAQTKIMNMDIPKRSPAVVNTPSPERLIFIATAFAPKIMHRSEVKMEVRKGRSLLLGVFEAILV